MDYIREIIFGELESPQLQEIECQENDSEMIAEVAEVIGSDVDTTLELILDATAGSVVDTSLQIVEEPLENSPTYDLNESWREKYNRLISQAGEEYDENNKTDEKKAEEKAQKAVRKFETIFKALFSDWEEYDGLVNRLSKSLETSLETLEDDLPKEEETFMNSTDFHNQGSEFGDEEHARNSQKLETSRNDVDTLEFLSQTEKDEAQLLAENEILKIKLQELESEKELREAEESEKRKQFLIQLDETLNTELARVKDEFSNIKKRHKKIMEENKQLLTKVDEQDKQIMSFYSRKAENQDDYPTLLAEKNKLKAEKKQVKVQLKSLERKNEKLEKDCEDLRVKLDQELLNNDKKHLEYEEKLSCFLKNMDMFKAETEERLETKVKRLEDRNLKLSKDNNDLRCRILDMSLHGIMAKPDKADAKDSPQSA